MILGIHHISMKCGTQEAYARAKDFYLRVLGMTAVREWPAGIMLSAGNCMIEIFCNGAGITEKGAIRHFALLTDDIDALAQKIREAGYPFFIAPDNRVIPSDPPYPIRIAFCTGPLGEEIELFQERKSETDAAEHAGRADGLRAVYKRLSAKYRTEQNGDVLFLYFTGKSGKLYRIYADPCYVGIAVQKTVLARTYWDDLKHAHFDGADDTAEDISAEITYLLDTYREE